ncbi:MAG TPA: hypothetical protein VJR89_04355 [Polyangiales bacterium]|nr:hypothetical protein [Polyangiales bacterium]
MMYERLRRGFVKVGCVVFVAGGWLAACSPAPYIGSKDCKVIAGVLPNDPFYDSCDHCQGRACSHMDCTAFPCHDERRIVQACSADQDCKELRGASCGTNDAGHHVCRL